VQRLKHTKLQFYLKTAVFWYVMYVSWQKYNVQMDIGTYLAEFLLDYTVSSRKMIFTVAAVTNKRSHNFTQCFVWV